MKTSRSLLVAGVTGAALAGAIFAPSAAFADASVAFSASTVCPGESVTFSVNGVSDGTEVTLDPPQTFILTFSGTTLPTTNTAITGAYTYQELVTKAGGGATSGTYVVKVDDAGTIVAETSLGLLAECPPATLPDTGIDTVAIAAAGGVAAAAALAGAAFVVIRRRKA